MGMEIDREFGSLLNHLVGLPSNDPGIVNFGGQKYSRGAMSRMLYNGVSQEVQSVSGVTTGPDVPKDKTYLSEVRFLRHEK